MNAKQKKQQEKVEARINETFKLACQTSEAIWRMPSTRAVLLAQIAAPLLAVNKDRCVLEGAINTSLQQAAELLKASKNFCEVP